MSPNKFFKYLGLTILVSIAVHFFINVFLPLSVYNDILFCSIIFFTLICVLIYWLSVRGTKTNKTNLFLFIIIINVFVKLVSAFIFIMVYVKMKSPEDKYFLVPFLMTYLIFTFFETIFLSSQARQTK